MGFYWLCTLGALPATLYVKPFEKAFVFKKRRDGAVEMG